MGKPRPKYTAELKRCAVQLYNERGTTYAEVAREIGVDPSSLADDALRMAIVRRRPPGGCIRHSDHGSQYVSLLIGKTMREAGIRPSMGSIASPWDNAAMESLMGLVKAECVHARTFETRDQAALETFDYIECFYNRVRIHSALGNLSPEEFEARHAQEAASAA